MSHLKENFSLFGNASDCAKKKKVFGVTVRKAGKNYGTCLCPSSKARQQCPANYFDRVPTVSSDPGQDNLAKSFIYKNGWSGKYCRDVAGGIKALTNESNINGTVHQKLNSCIQISNWAKEGKQFPECSQGISTPFLKDSRKGNTFSNMKKVGKDPNYGQCPCKTSDCHEGYFNKFPEFSSTESNEINRVLSQNGYSGRSCGEMFGNDPTKIDECVELWKLQQNADNIAEDAKGDICSAGVPILGETVYRGEKFCKCECLCNSTFDSDQCPGNPKCPYDFNQSFPTFPEDKKLINPLEKSMRENGYEGKSCGTISGGCGKFNNKTYEACNKFYKLYNNMDNTIGEMIPSTNIIVAASNSKSHMRVNETLYAGCGPADYKLDSDGNYYNSNKTRQLRPQSNGTFKCYQYPEGGWYGDTATVTNPVFSSGFNVVETFDENNLNGELSNRLKSFNNSLEARNTSYKDVLNRKLTSAQKLQSTAHTWTNAMNGYQEADKELGHQLQTKKRLIEINNADARKKDTTIINIIGASSSLAIIVFAWTAYMSGKISMKTLLMLCFVTIVVFVIFMVFYSSTDNKLKPFADTLKKDILNAGDKLNMAALEWVDDNCDCPADAVENNPNNTPNDKAAIANKNFVPYEDNIYYKDGTKKWKISAKDMAEENGPLPCDSIDTDQAEYNVTINKSRKQFDNIVSNIQAQQ